MYFKVLILIFLSFYHVQSQNQNCHDISAVEDTKFMDLSVECKLMILEEMDLHDLSTMALTSRQFSYLAGDVFRRKYRTKELHILGPLISPLNDSVRYQKIIVVQNFEMALMILQAFGSDIEKLHLHYHHIELDQRIEIHNYIEKYCSESLKSIIMDNCYENMFNGFNAPLKMVETVEFAGNVISFSNTSLTLNEMFPNLRDLNLNRVVTTNSDLFDFEFPLLDRVTIRFSFSEDMRVTVRKFLEKNPQIRYLSMNDCNSLEYLKFASESIPNLEDLRVILSTQEEEYEGEPIHFRGLKEFSIYLGGINTTGVFFFDKLKRLELFCVATSGIMPAFFRKVASNFREAPGLHDGRITEIIRNAGTLEELSILSLSDIGSSTVGGIVDRLTNLKELHLLVDSLTLFNSLENQYGGRWNVTKGDIEFFMDRI